jgi:hypothetical protein
MFGFSAKAVEQAAKYVLAPAATIPLLLTAWDASVVGTFLVKPVNPLLLLSQLATFIRDLWPPRMRQETGSSVK